MSRYNTRLKQYEDSDGVNTVVYYGDTITGQIGQQRNNTYRYEHYAVLHGSDVESSPVIKSLDREYFF